MSFKPVHAYSLTAWPRAHNRQDGASLDLYNRRWNTRKDSLWWSAIAYKVFALKRVVRSHATRKLRVAFAESLKRKGFAPDGARLPGAVARFGAEPLFGTAQLTPDYPIMKTRMKHLVLETDKAVQRIMNLQDRRVSWERPSLDRSICRGRGEVPKPARYSHSPFKQDEKVSPNKFTIRWQ